MAILEVRRLGDPILRQQAKPVEKITKRLKILIDDMIDTMYEAQGVGLAAPQVGVSRRIIVVDTAEGARVLVNPRIISSTGQDIDTEGCLSIPGVTGYVERARAVVAEGLDEDGHPTRLEGQDLLSRALQHEVDHLDGVLFIDKARTLTSSGASHVREAGVTP